MAGQRDEYDTSEFHAYTNVSLGTSNNVDIGDRTMYFDNNAVTKINCRNLFYCQYLNLRYSSFR